MKSKAGLCLVISDDAELVSTLVHMEPRGMGVSVWCPTKAGPLQSAIKEACRSVGGETQIVKGDLAKDTYFAQWQSTHPLCVVLALKDDERHGDTRNLILATLPDAKILSLRMGHPELEPRSLQGDERELVLTWAELLLRPVSAELRHVQSAHHVKAVRDVLDSGDKIALLVQPDPDPDGLASALALRSLLGRNKLSTPVVSFGKVTRPENLAMMRLLDIEVLTIKPADLTNYDRVALLDTQPSHFSEPLPRVDVIIDHHPIGGPYDVPYQDIRPFYGATSTILTEYLRAAATPIGQRLATALLYGIKADTLLLNREVIDADLDTFVSLYPAINYNLLRRIEKPELPMKFAPVLADALKHLVCEDNVLVSCMGAIEREDLVPQVADFMMQFEDVEWVVCAGVLKDIITVSVRNVGYVRNAGDVVKRIVSSGFGHGGGHRTMAKAIFSLKTWGERFGRTDRHSIRDALLGLFLEGIG